MKTGVDQSWFLVWPDGTIHPGWGYSTLKELKEQAPGLITGRVIGWSELAWSGYRYVRCSVIPTAKVKS